MDARPYDAPERLLAESEWLARLARGLVSKSEDAADLVQDTFVAALEHPPEAGRPLRPWLARIAHNLAIRSVRGRARREVREERIARPEALASTSEVVERVAMQRTVVEAVLALDEPYRSTLLLRYWDDLAPRRIAARMSVPVETVRTRLKRGLAALRERLDRRHGDRDTWMSALLPVARGGALPSAGAGSVTIASAVGGMLAMNSVAKVGLAVVVLIAAAWIVRDFTVPLGSSESLQANSEHKSFETAAGSDPDHVLATESGDPQRREVTAAIAPSVSARNEIRCTVIDDVTGTPLVGAHAAVYVGESGIPTRKRRATGDSRAGGVVLLEDSRADRRLIAELEVWAEERAVLWVIVPGVQTSPESPRVTDLGEIHLPRGSAVRGRVVASDGATPVPGARLLLRGVAPSSYGHFGGIDVGASDSAGNFQFERRFAPPRYGLPSLLAFTNEGMGWATIGVVEKRETVGDVVVRIRPSVQLEVEVVESAGTPIEGVAVSVWPKFEPLGLPNVPDYDAWLGSDPWVIETFNARTNAQGLARFARLPIDDDPGHSENGMQYKVAANAKGKREATRRVDLDPKHATHVKLTLDPFVGVKLSGRVLSKDGAPIVDATVREKRPGSGSGHSDAQGQFTLDLSSTKVVSLEAEARGYATRIIERNLAADETTPSIDITLTRESLLEGRFVDPSGTPLAGFSLFAQRSDESQHDSNKTGADGHFTIEGLDENYWSLNVNLPDDGSQWEGPGRFTACSADSPLTVQMNRIEPGQARIEVELLDALTHKPLTPRAAHIDRIGDHGLARGRGLAVAREFGILRADGLSAGRWRLRVETVEGARGEREIAVAPTDLDLRLQWELAGPGRIVGSVSFDDVPAEQRPARGFLIILPFDEGQWVPVAGQAAQKVTRGFAPLAAADGWVFSIEDVAALQPVMLELSAGPYVSRTEVIVPVQGEAKVVIHPQPGGNLRFEREGERAITDFDLALQCAGDSTLRESNHWDPSGGERVLRTVIVPAGHVRWRIRYWSPGHTEDGGIVTLEGDADVAGGATTSVGIRF